MIHERYKFDNLPINQKDNVNIDQLGAIGRMLSVQDDYTDDRLNTLAQDLAKVVAEQNTLIVKFIEEQAKINKKINTRLTGHDKVMKAYAKRLTDLEQRTDDLELRIKDLMK